MIGPVASFPVASSPGATSLPAVFTVYVNSVDITGNVFIGSSGSQGFSVSEILTGSTTGNLVLIEPDAPTGPTLDIQIGHEVIIEHRTGRIFGGLIQDLRRSNPGQSDILFYHLSLRDYSACLSRRLAAVSFEDTSDPVTQTAGDIITSLHGLYLTDGCITLGDIDDGPLIQKANFNYVTVESALNELQGLTGNTFFWKVDPFRVLTFKERTAIVAPYEINETQMDIVDLDFKSDKENYRNRQFVRGGKAETVARTEEFEADGKLKAFTLTLPVSRKPVIKVNTVAVSPAAIGVKGIDEDTVAVLWLFSIGSEIVSAKTAPTSGDDIEITFQGLFPIIVQRDDCGEQTSRAAVELGNGLYEALDVDETLNLSTSRQKAEGLLDKYARVPQKITYVTDRPGEIRAGQLQTVNLTRLNVVAAGMLIEQVDISLNGNDLRRTVKATDGREWLEWLEFFRGILKDEFTIRENESLLIPISVIDALDFSDSVTVNLADDLNVYTTDPYTWMLVGTTYSIGKKIADPTKPLFGDSLLLDGPQIGDPVI